MARSSKYYRVGEQPEAMGQEWLEREFPIDTLVTTRGGGRAYVVGYDEWNGGRAGYALKVSSVPVAESEVEALKRRWYVQVVDVERGGRTEAEMVRSLLPEASD